MRAQTSPLRRLVAEVALSLAVLLLAEFGLRAFISHNPKAPLPALFQSPITTGKYLAYRDLEAQEAPLDVVLMGLSQMMRVSAGRIQAMADRGDSAPVRIFNFAGPFHWVDFNRRLLRDILLKIKAPKVVVLGLTPLDLSYERSDSATERLVESLPVFSIHAGTPVAALQAMILWHSDLFLYREVLRRALSGKPMTQMWVTSARATDERGDIAGVLHIQGNSVRQMTALWKQNYVNNLSRFDQLMESNVLFDHITALARFCRAHKIEMILVNSPVHPIFAELLPRGEDDYRVFTAHLRQLAHEESVAFFDPTHGAFGPPEFYQDAAHHNEAGSIWISREIGKFLLDQGVLEESAASDGSTRRPLPEARRAHGHDRDRGGQI